MDFVASKEGEAYSYPLYNQFQYEKKNQSQYEKKIAEDYNYSDEM
jgi:hypothetical protein